MRILVTGKGGPSGSWQIRGEQLGAAIGAEVFPQAETAEIRNADLVVVVKRTPPTLIQKIRTASKPWVYDVIDGWPQPAGNDWNYEQAIRWLRMQLRELRPNAVIFPTTRMWQDSEWFGGALVLPHHAWPKYQPRPVAGAVSRVGYEGDPTYLGRWRPIVETECARRGWQFIVNGDLGSCQLGVALREAEGHPARFWKANTKLANLQALGLPALISPESSYEEFGSGSEFRVTEPADIWRGFDALSDYETRLQISEAAQAAAPRLDDVAETLRGWLLASRY